MNEDKFSVNCWESFLRELKFRGRSPNTIWDYRSFIGHFYKWLKTKNILFENVKKETVKEYLTIQTSSDTTVNGRLRHLKSYFNWLQKEEYLETNPTLEIGFKRVETKQREILQPDDVELIIAYLKRLKGWKYIRGMTLIRVAFETGLRISEILGIKLEDIDITGNSIKVCGKGKKWRVVGFGDLVRKELIQYMKKRDRKFPDSEYLFCSEKGGVKLQPSSVAALIRDAGWAVLKRRVHFHLLRHSFATLHAVSGANAFLLMNQLGHTTVAMSSKYVQAAQSPVAVEYFKVNSLTDNGRKKKVVA